MVKECFNVLAKGQNCVIGVLAGIYNFDSFKIGARASS